MSRIEIKMTPEAGDLLLSRNEREEDNSSPGFWNHVAIYTGHNAVIHAIRKKGVIITPYEIYYEEVANIKLIRLKIGTAKRQEIVKCAYKYLGVKYKALQSIFFRLFRRSFNCVGLARKCCKDVIGKDPRWSRPDDLLSYPDYLHCKIK